MTLRSPERQGNAPAWANLHSMDLDRTLRLGSTGWVVSGNPQPAPDGLVAALATPAGMPILERIAGSQARFAVETLAVAACLSSTVVRTRALELMPTVCRTSAELFRFLSIVDAGRGWGRSLRRAVQTWYSGRPLHELAREAALTNPTSGWTHRDVLRLAHVRPQTPSQAGLFRWIATGAEVEEPSVAAALKRIARSRNPLEVASLMRDHRIPMSCVAPQWRESADVWAAVLVSRPVTDVLPHLAQMGRCGLLVEGSAAIDRLAQALSDTAAYSPIEAANALTAYARASDVALPQVVGWLDRAWSAAARALPGTGLRTVWSLDCRCGDLLAPALIEMAREGAAHPVTSCGSVRDLPITPLLSLLDAQRIVSAQTGEPSLEADVVDHAERCGMECDAFVFAGKPRGADALRIALETYARSTGIRAVAVFVSPEPSEIPGIWCLTAPGDPAPWIRDVVACARSTT